MRPWRDTSRHHYFFRKKYAFFSEEIMMGFLVAGQEPGVLHYFFRAFFSGGMKRHVVSSCGEREVGEPADWV
jgi:hypothetical protein